MQFFEEVLVFQVTCNRKREEKIQLILCQLDVGGWQKEEGTRLTEKDDFLENFHVLSCFLQLKCVLLISNVFCEFFFFSEQ